jgi:hypothetical protein
MSQAKHIAASGIQAGQWVNCPAQKQCTLMNTKDHTTAAELEQARVYAEQQTGQKIQTFNDVKLVDVLKYRVLSDSKKQEVIDALEARREAVKTKKANTKTQPGTQLRTNRFAATEAYNKTGDANEFFDTYYAQYPHISKLPLKDKEVIFEGVETRFGRGSKSKSVGKTDNFTDTNKRYAGIDEELKEKRFNMNNFTLLNSAHKHEAELAKSKREAARRAAQDRADAATIAQGASKAKAKEKTISLYSTKLSFLTVRGASNALAVQNTFRTIAETENTKIKYSTRSSFMSTTFHDIEIIGPKHVHDAFKDWMQQFR